MEKRAHNACCYRMLSILNVLKEGSLRRPELEGLLCELDRLIFLVTTCQPQAEVCVERLGEHEYRVKNTRIAQRGGEVEIVETDVLGLKAYYATLPLKSQPIRETVEYVRAVSEHRVCMRCLRRASQVTLLCCLVIRKDPSGSSAYHIECAEGACE
ncbi:uncharacterized protein NEMAJ01_1217 [Nematocida major]|uniref:uncharacterized protein n=1 Tax=Nematocida major TaxID=1912982 RepID=UPI002007B9E8|nr:uncharacterized protein NEMAJ01_1217 [Nematocida major]KAH9386321.1 hypothetical protein NEMAJ01_1217 [Nematocida major]